MAGISWRRALTPVARIFDRADRAAHSVPSAWEETTRFPGFPWDLRTIILVFPPESPFRYLNLNLLLGFTGAPFDRPDRFHGPSPLDALDVQFCLEGRERAVTSKDYHSVARELTYQPDAVQFKLLDRLEFSGQWPSYQLRYRQPEEQLELDLSFESAPDFHWWAYLPGAYYHYTSFGLCRMEWKWGKESGTLELPGLHDHGWGRNLLPLRLPVRVFRYEVLRLPDAAAAISLWTEAPGGFELKNVAVHRSLSGPTRFFPRYQIQVLEWDVFPNYANHPCRVPRRWLGRQQSPSAEFRYEALRASPPRPLIGNGFLSAFDFQGSWTDSPDKKISGEGYVEQLGLLKT